MGKKKYYCDFCNRFFNDDKNTRQKHLNSVGHLNLKKEHYNMFRDPETLLREESVKRPCRKFHYEGFCPFGGHCTFSHYSKQDLEAIRSELYFRKQKQELEDPTIESWFLKYNQGREEKSQKSQKLLWSSVLPPSLLPSVGFLPPSLLPFPIRDFVESELEGVVHCPSSNNAFFNNMEKATLNEDNGVCHYWYTGTPRYKCFESREQHFTLRYEGDK